MRRSLGLDIGTAGHSLRWVELEEERGRLHVRSSGTAALDHTARAAGEAMKALTSERRWKGREVIVSLPRLQNRAGEILARALPVHRTPRSLSATP